MSSKFLILGAGGHGRSLQSIFEVSNSYELVGYLDDNKQNSDMHIVGKISDLESFWNEDINLIAGIGENSTRKRLYLSYCDTYPFESLIHQSSIISDTAEIGVGNSIMPRTTINPFSKIGDNVIINTGVIIEHDVKVGDHSNISPCAVILGGAIVDEDVFIGSGSIIRENVRIGSGSIIGMGSVITKDIPPGVVVYGSSAKIQGAVDSNTLVFR